MMSTEQSSNQIEHSVRNRLSKGQRSLIIQYLDNTFGHKCAYPGCTNEKLELDHINGDPSDNRLSNFRWLCKSHNLSARHAIPSTRLNVSEREFGDSASSEIEINREKEPMFRLWLFRRTGDPVPLYVHEAVYGSAESIGASPVTTRRYLGKAVSPQGSYVLETVKAENRTLKQVLPK